MLFLRNDPTAPPALLGEVFAESGFTVDTFDVVPAERPDDPWLEVDFPDPGDYDVVVPLGARWAAYDDSVPWLAAEMDLLRRALAAGSGVLGVCFGGQLLARALGGAVDRSPAPEIGWCEVDSSDPGLVPGGPWFQWHFDRFAVPPGAREVARNDRAVQAFVRGRALGLQFHPEVDAGLVARWIAEDDGDMTRLGVDPDLLERRTGAEVDGAVQRLRTLVDAFLRLRPEHLEDHSQRLG